EQIEKLIGFFVNTLPLRINLHREMQFTELLSQVKKTTIDAYDHQDVPFELLVDELQIERDSSRNALFQVLFVLQNAQLQAVDLEKATMELEILDSDTAKFDMSVQIFELEDTLSIKLEYNTDLFFDDTIERFLAHYETILASVIHNQKAKIGELSILPQSEYTKLVSEWNEKSATYNGNQCIHELFEAAVHKTPSATALIY
ncbi:condensation domain-containing protein, partial [Staphylococcus aureus]